MRRFRGGADDWPGWLGPQRDGVWREEGILDHFPAGGPEFVGGSTRFRLFRTSGGGQPRLFDGLHAEGADQIKT